MTAPRVTPRLRQPTPPEDRANPLLAALQDIAHGSKANPACSDPVAELLRVDRIACEALARHEVSRSAIGPEDDALDGILFRFWIRAASSPGGWPTALMEAIDREVKAEGHATPAAYRRALMALARDKGVNLPG